jgi:flagellar biosynthesis protein FliR
MKSTAFPDTSPSPWPPTRCVMWALFWGIAFVLALRGVFHIFDHHSLPAPARLALAVVPFVPAVFCIRSWVRWLGGLDELQQRMQLQSFAAVFPGLLLAVVANDLLRVARFIGGVEWGFRSIGLAMLAIYTGTFLWLWWRNR